MYGS
jgi:urease accessory protein